MILACYNYSWIEFIAPFILCHEDFWLEGSDRLEKGTLNRGTIRSIDFHNVFFFIIFTFPQNFPHFALICVHCGTEKVKNINLSNKFIYRIILLTCILFWLKLQKICPMLWRTSVHLAVKNRKKLPTKLCNSWSIINQKYGLFSKQNMIQQEPTGNIIFRIELKKNLIKLTS